LGERSNIEWTDSTWNPVTGCTKVSAGCDNCYAYTLAHVRLASVYLRQLPVVRSAENDADPFAVRLWPARLADPARWREPRMVFVNSMSDLFHVDVPDAFVRQIFEVMLRETRHIYQVLTKRPSRAVRWFKLNRDLFPSGEIPSHVWMGTSVEQQEVDYRIAHLRQLPAQVRFLSCEPLIGPLDLEGLLDGIHWVIAGGESGAKHRPMLPEWATLVRDRCEEASVAFFFKQWGGRTPKAGGRSLQGRTWDDRPRSVNASLSLAV
jgi:protein gp37